jgi:GMP synthase (glutamine-hydrolysing)
MMKPDGIAILDFGSQYCHLISRRIRAFNVYSEIFPYDVSIESIMNIESKFNIKGIILSGGPRSVLDKDAPTIDFDMLKIKKPILGICYGHQLIAHLFNGKVIKSKKGEFGLTFVNVKRPIGVLKGLKKRIKVWMSHNESVIKLPKDFDVLAYSENCPIAAFKHKNLPIYGLQWHPEVSHSDYGNEVLANFVFNVCKSKPNWRIGNFIKNAINEIKETVKDKKAIMALSGGVDSSTALVLASKALGKGLTAVFVDNGFMRDKEPELIKKTFKKLNINFVYVDAKERFLKKLKGIKDPEEKRKIIGKEFIKVFEEEAKKVKADFLIQGTIYPDRIESGFTRHSDKIKTHHNVGGLPLRIKFKGIVEPLKDLYKDEVRALAKKLGLPKEIIWRQPFPGPGLAVRIIGEITKEKINILKNADRIVREELERANIKKLWQYFAVLLSIKTTGIKGDSRSYGYVIAIRAVESEEAMTANFAKLPYKVLERISTRITNEIPFISRVVYDITNKPPATIEWE